MIQPEDIHTALSQSLLKAEEAYKIEILGDNFEILLLDQLKILHKQLNSLPLQIYLIAEKDEGLNELAKIINSISTIFLGLYDKKSLKSWNNQVEFFSPFQKVIGELFTGGGDLSNLIMRLNIINEKKENGDNENIAAPIENGDNENIAAPIENGDNENIAAPIENSDRFQLKLTVSWNTVFLLLGVVLLVSDLIFIEDQLISLILTYLWISCIIGVLFNAVGVFLKIKEIKMHEYTIISFLLCLNSGVIGYLTYNMLLFFFPV